MTHSECRVAESSSTLKLTRRDDFQPNTRPDSIYTGLFVYVRKAILEQNLLFSVTCLPVWNDPSCLRINHSSSQLNTQHLQSSHSLYLPSLPGDPILLNNIEMLALFLVVRTPIWHLVMMVVRKGCETSGE